MFESVSRILVVAAHPDDEMLGCGGTLAKLAAEGKKIRILLLGEGPTARLDAEHTRELAQTSALAASASLGISDVHFCNLPDNRFDSLELLDIVQIIESHAQNFCPNVVFTHHVGDMNFDHCITHRATMTAFRPLPDCDTTILLGFETLSSTEYSPAGTGSAFCPNFFVNIEDTLLIKQTALHSYASEMRPWPHPRSYEGVEHLACMRGAQCGCNAAEAFILYRYLTSSPLKRGALRYAR